MSSKKIKIFLTGATGYIGGSVLTGLLRHPNAKHFDISVLIRGDEDRIKKISSLGVTPVIGANESHDVIEKAASESDVVIHTANSADDIPSTESILSGLNKRTKSTGKAVIYIHTSGTGVLIEDVRGRKGSSTVYSDLNPDQINGLADEQMHRNVDLIVIKAGEANPLLKTAIIIPPTIYGVGLGPFNRTSIQIPALIRAALKRGKAETIGPGEATWDSIHIADLVDAFIVLLDQFLAAYGPDAKADAKASPYLTTGREGYYFVENGRHSWRQLAEKIGEVLHKKGIAKSAQVTSFPENEVEGIFFGPVSWLALGSQANSKAERLRKLGWKPHQPAVLDCIEEQVDACINETKK